jgi:hypothetical protein
MQRSTRQTPNRLPRSFSGKVASTNVRSDLPAALGDEDEVDIQSVENTAKDGHADAPNTKQVILE